MSGILKIKAKAALKLYKWMEDDDFDPTEHPWLIAQQFASLDRSQFVELIRMYPWLLDKTAVHLSVDSNTTPSHIIEDYLKEQIYRHLITCMRAVTAGKG